MNFNNSSCITQSLPSKEGTLATPSALHCSAFTLNALNTPNITDGSVDHNDAQLTNGGPYRGHTVCNGIHCNDLANTEYHPHSLVPKIKTEDFYVNIRYKTSKGIPNKISTDIDRLVELIDIMGGRIAEINVGKINEY